VNLEVVENNAGKEKIAQLSPNWEEVEEDTDKEEKCSLHSLFVFISHNRKFL
jgi:hypothetical protein